MRFIIRTVMLIALVWIGLLLSGYGVLIGSKENAAELGLQCTYLTARGTSTVQYLHTKSGFLGITIARCYAKAISWSIMVKCNK